MGLLACVAGRAGKVPPCPLRSPPRHATPRGDPFGPTTPSSTPRQKELGKRESPIHPLSPRLACQRRHWSDPKLPAVGLFFSKKKMKLLLGDVHVLLFTEGWFCLSKRDYAQGRKDRKERNFKLRGQTHSRIHTKGGKGDSTFPILFILSAFLFLSGTKQRPSNLTCLSSIFLI